MKFLSNIRERYYWKHMVTAIAALSAAVTLLTALFNLEWIKSCGLCGFIGTAIVVVGSFAYAYWQTRSKPKIVLDLALKLKLTIIEGNLFDMKGVICIPFNEYFDTHVGDRVVDEDTLHGKFITTYFKDRIPELKNKIQFQLSNHNFEINEQGRRIKGCPDRKYELGTCIDIREGENTYVLFAFTHFDENDTAYISRAEYTEVVHKLMHHLNGMVEGRPVYLPLFGIHMSRMGRTPQRVLLHLVNTLDFDDSFTIPGGLNIVVKSLKDADVNLTTLEYIVKHGISESEQN